METAKQSYLDEFQNIDIHKKNKKAKLHQNFSAFSEFAA